MFGGLDLLVAALIVAWVVRGEDIIQWLIATLDRYMPDTERRRW